MLDNAFGSGSFLVAAALEGRRFIGIERNEEVHLFKKKQIDYMKVARMRLAEARRVMDAPEQTPCLASDWAAPAKSVVIGRRAMVDVDAVMHQAAGDAA